MGVWSPKVRNTLVLMIGVAVFLLGVLVALSPVPTTVNTMCEDGGCSALASIPLPALGLGSTIIVLGIAVFALGLDADNWS